MDKVTKAKITAVFPGQGFAVTEVAGYGSVTFSLESFEDEYPPEAGDWVLLKSVTKRDKGWRAKAACLFSPENETLLLPESYDDTVLGKILQKWDPVFFLSVRNDEWEELIRYQDPKVKDLTIALKPINALEAAYDDRIKARVILLLLLHEIRELPFSVPSREAVNTMMNVENYLPFVRYDRDYREVNVLEGLSDNLLALATDLIVEQYLELKDISEAKDEKLGSGHRKSVARKWMLVYLELIPFLVTVLEERIPKRAVELIGLYDIVMARNRPFKAIVDRVQSAELVFGLIVQMEAWIKDTKHNAGHGNWESLVAEYVSALEPGYYHKGSWKDKLWGRVIRFAISQQAPYSVFDLKLICKLLLDKPLDSHPVRWSDEEKNEMLSWITEYLIFGNSSWIVYGEYPDTWRYRLTEWVLDNTRPGNDRLKKQIQAYKNRTKK